MPEQKAILIRVDGTTTPIEPKNGSDFVFDGELYPLLDTDMIQMIPMPDGRIMLMDEEGKIRVNPKQPNEEATKLVRGYIADSDYIVGDVVVCPPDMLH